ncbi:hypothetical protein ROLI_022000 [Roseobacter fucihabitans]|uniref:Uncharacterized protein n=1 Tax=Roseobacter fucihabitans TaxID=1537242 RepID=A0ABZ2BSV4_9RHOB|nr:hypothetical protein [Roseobacter litoralis]
MSTFKTPIAARRAQLFEVLRQTYKAETTTAQYLSEDAKPVSAKDTLRLQSAATRSLQASGCARLQ